jgi:hypothetical protein
MGKLPVRQETNHLAGRKICSVTWKNHRWKHPGGTYFAVYKKSRFRKQNNPARYFEALMQTEQAGAETIM